MRGYKNLPTQLQQETTVQPKFPEALRFWWKLGWISFGGTAAHLATLHEELVVKKCWIQEAEFFHALSHCMILPGPEAQQLATYIGWKLHGIRGGITAGTLFVLPSTIVLLALSLVYVRFGSLPWVAAMIYGLRPAVVVLVALALQRVAARTLHTRLQQSVALAAFAAITFFQAAIPAVMLAAILLGILLVSFFPRFIVTTQSGNDMHSISATEVGYGKALLRSIVRTAAIACVLWSLPLLALYCLSPDFAFWRQLSLFFTKTALVTIGGSYTVIPYVAHQVVTKYHWLTPTQMLDGFSLAETTPGPLIIVVAYIGFIAAFNHFHGSVIVATLALFVTVFYVFHPCFAFVFAGAPFVKITYGKQGIESVLRLITAVVVAAMLNLLLFLLRGTLFPTDHVAISGLDVFAAIWVAVSFVLLQKLRIGMAWFVGLSLLSGLAHLWIARL